MVYVDYAAAFGLINACCDRIKQVQMNQKDMRKFQRQLCKMEETVKATRVDSSLPEALKFNDVLSEIENHLRELIHVISKQLERSLILRAWDASEIKSKLKKLDRDLHQNYARLQVLSSGIQVGQWASVKEGMQEILEKQHQQQYDTRQVLTLLRQCHTTPPALATQTGALGPKESNPLEQLLSPSIETSTREQVRRDHEQIPPFQHHRNWPAADPHGEDVIRAFRHDSKHNVIILFDGQSVRLNHRGNFLEDFGTKVDSDLVKVRVLDDHSHLLEGSGGRYKLRYTLRRDEIMRSYEGENTQHTVTFLGSDTEAFKLARTWYTLILRAHQGEKPTAKRAPPPVTVTLRSVQPISKRLQDRRIEVRSAPLQRSWHREWHAPVEDLTEPASVGPLPVASFHRRGSWNEVALDALVVRVSSGMVGCEEDWERVDEHTSSDIAERAYEMELTSLRQLSRDTEHVGRGRRPQRDTLVDGGRAALGVDGNGREDMGDGRGGRQEHGKGKSRGHQGSLGKHGWARATYERR